MEQVFYTGSCPIQGNISGGWASQAPRIAAQNALLKSRSKYSVRKSTGEKLGQNHQRQTTRGLRPRIFVNTNFSRNHGRAPPRPKVTRKPYLETQTGQYMGGLYKPPVGVKGLSAGSPVLAYNSQSPQDTVLVNDMDTKYDYSSLIQSGTGDLKTFNPSALQPYDIVRPSYNGTSPPDADNHNNFVHTQPDDGVPDLAKADVRSGPGRPLGKASQTSTSQSLSPYKAADGPPGDGSERKDGLSPSDRPIPIGIEVREIPEQGLPTPSDQPLENYVAPGERPGADGSLTPTILITPAKEVDTPSPPSTGPDLRSRPRIPSSVYSRRFSELFLPSDEPMPPLPTTGSNSFAYPKPSRPSSDQYKSRRDSAATQFEEDDSPQSRNQRGSACTFFEEEDDSASAPRTIRSPQSALTSWSDLSPYSTNDPRRQSTGWWNYITTPFLTRSNTIMSKQAISDQHPPHLPSIEHAIAVKGAQDGKMDKLWEATLSPTSPQIILQTGHDTAWTDLTRWEKERNATQTLKDNTLSQEEATGKDSSNHSQAIRNRSVQDWLQEAVSHSSEIPPTSRGVTQGLLQPSLYHDAQNGDVDKALTAQSIHSPNDRELAILQTGETSPDLHSRSGNTLRITSNTNQTRTNLPPPLQRNITNFSDLDTSPTVYQANIASVVHAGTPATKTINVSRGRPAAEGIMEQRPRSPPPDPPPYSPPRARLQNGRDGPIAPVVHSTAVPVAVQPRQILNRGTGGAMSSRAAALPLDVPLAHVQYNRPYNGSRSRSNMFPTTLMDLERPAEVIRTREADSRSRSNMFPTTLRDLERPAEVIRTREADRRRGEKEDAVARRVGGLWRGRACFGKNGCFGRGGVEARKRRRWCAGLFTIAVLLIILVLVLAIALPRKRKHVQTEQSPWANITGWPPIPTGVFTITKPDLTKANTGCVFPSTMWSCALPKELQNSASTPDQPDFRIQIIYSLGDISNVTSAQPTSKALLGRSLSSLDLVMHMSSRIRSRGTNANVTSSGSLTSPSVEDQQFMGKTTDNITSTLKEGEESPISLTLLPVDGPTSSKQVEQRSQGRYSKRGSDPFPDILATIPRPEVNVDGTAKAANLLPPSIPQQLRLYDRNLDSEHYGFYGYFDRSIFLKSTSLLNESDIDRGSVPDDLNGGSTEHEARVRCTWAQTRFLIQIWTRKNGSSLLHSGPSFTSQGSPTLTSSAVATANGAHPGFFPYPVTITTDRHGGDVTKKMIYCYGLDDRTNIVRDQAKIQVENRGFGGQLVGGGQGPLGKDRVTIAEGGMGGIDGGTGGCACGWQNFLE